MLLFVERHLSPVIRDDICESNDWKGSALSDVDHPVYAKATTPAREGQTLYVEDEAQGLARRVRKSEGGERLHNLSQLHAELRTLQNNQNNGYMGWEFRIAVLGN
jgi:hypothetical protein